MVRANQRDGSRSTSRPRRGARRENAPYGGYWRYRQLRSRGTPSRQAPRVSATSSPSACRPPYFRRHDFTFTPEREALRAGASSSPRPPTHLGTARGAPRTGVSIAEDEGGAGLSFVEEAVLFEELGRALYKGPYFATTALTLPALPPDLRSEVAGGQASWTLAFGPLVPDLDTADRVAIVGGDGVYELEGAEREVLATTDESRTLGVVRGGGPGRRLAGSAVLAEIEARSRAVSTRSCGVRLALEDAIQYASSREQFGKKIGVYQTSRIRSRTPYTQSSPALAGPVGAWCVCDWTRGFDRGPAAGGRRQRRLVCEQAIRSSLASAHVGTPPHRL